MAKYNISNNHNSKRAIILGDCNDGDIVSVPTENIEVGIISDEDPHVNGEICVIDLSDGCTHLVQVNTACRRYTGTLQFDRKDFEDFI